MSDRTDSPRLPLTLTQLLDHLDSDVLLHLDDQDVREALNVPEPPVTFEALTEALCLGDSASEHPAYDVLDVWAGFHRDVALLVGARLGASLRHGRHGLHGLHLADYQSAWSEAAAAHRGVLERRRAVGALGAASPEDPSRCDTWCTARHDGADGEAFHHLGATTTVVLTDSAGRDEGEVEVGLARWVAGPDEPGRCDPVTVNVSWPQNAGGAGLTSLEVDEAERLGRALLLTVTDARSAA